MLYMFWSLGCGEVLAAAYLVSPVVKYVTAASLVFGLSCGEVIAAASLVCGLSCGAVK